MPATGRSTFSWRSDGILAMLWSLPVADFHLKYGRMGPPLNIYERLRYRFAQLAKHKTKSPFAPYPVPSAVPAVSRSVKRRLRHRCSWCGVSTANHLWPVGPSCHCNPSMRPKRPLGISPLSWLTMPPKRVRLTQTAVTELSEDSRVAWSSQELKVSETCSFSATADDRESDQRNPLYIAPYSCTPATPRPTHLHPHHGIPVRQ